ncbi:hypothetical protein VCHE16_3798 [Vibrio paracholerae HE-16]|nr:hypothetical protein VCHE16_3798 [Vibrio paracholerae HE-16]
MQRKIQAHHCTKIKPTFICFDVRYVRLLDAWIKLPLRVVVVMLL